MPFTANEVNFKCIRNYDFIQRNSKRAGKYVGFNQERRKGNNRKLHLWPFRP